jgi:hypothetical protein
MKFLNNLLTITLLALVHTQLKITSIENKEYRISKDRPKIECPIKRKATYPKSGDLYSITVFSSEVTYSFVDLLKDYLYVHINCHICPFYALLNPDELIKIYDHLSQKLFNFKFKGGILYRPHIHPLVDTNSDSIPVSIEYKQKFVDFLRVFDEIKIPAEKVFKELIREPHRYEALTIALTNLAIKQRLSKYKFHPNIKFDEKEALAKLKKEFYKNHYGIIGRFVELSLYSQIERHKRVIDLNKIRKITQKVEETLPTMQNLFEKTLLKVKKV